MGVDAAGLELVLWRDVDGRPCVMDARCPHQWSHLAAEGVVDGWELVCTAHFWRFDTRGVGSKVNVRGRRDAKADARTYPCREVDGRVQADLSAGPSGVAPA
jgi:phenylpropionate dioxygenase-like ring-hydroxylating dioxygenase large terminal subunit